MQANEVLQQYQAGRRDFSGEDFSGIDLSGADLSRADLSEANLKKVNFAGANLREADLSQADLSEANLSEANLIQADLRNANLTSAHNLSLAKLNKTNLKRAYLVGINLSRADLREANLSRANLTRADLSEADLSQANLSQADFSQANLSRANLNKTDLSRAELRQANLSQADLSEADLDDVDFTRANLAGTNLSGADLTKTSFFGASLKKANFNRAKFREADLSEADFRGANLSEADLREANLVVTLALGTNFENAKFTGACLEDWHYNNATNLTDINCDYVYLKKFQQERRPSNGKFAHGDFTRLFQKALETVDLIFRDGIDWQSFAAAFKKVQLKNGEDELSVQAIEKKKDGSFLVRVDVPPITDKASIEQSFWDEYQPILQAKEERILAYQEDIAHYREDINYQRQENTRLTSIIETMAAKDGAKYHIEQLKIAGSWSDNNQGLNIHRDSNMHQNQNNQIGNFGIGHMSGGEIQAGAKVAGTINEAQQQNLNEAAQEIQQLLEQLDNNYNTNSTSEKMSLATAAVGKIESNPAWKKRIISALKAGGTNAFEQLLNHPAASFLIAAMQDWQESAE